MNTQYDALNALLHDRHSCRGFLPDEIEKSTIEDIVAAAGRAPSWCNSQPWKTIITTPPETDNLRDALYDAATTTEAKPDIEWPTRYTGAYKDRRRACGFQLYDALNIAKDDRAASTKQMLENYRFFGAPHMALITTEADLGPYGALDCGGFITAFTLAAQALNVATIPQAAVPGFAPFLRDWFDIPAHRQILCAISFGRADESHPANQFRTQRAPLSEIISWR